MRKETYRVRALVFAYLFGPPRELSREDATRIYNAICTELKLDDLSFHFAPTPEESERSKGFRIRLERREGRGGLRILLEGRGIQEPMRLLIHADWPATEQHFKEQADMIAKGVWSSLGGEGDVVVAEVRVMGQCFSGRDHSVALFTDAVLGLRSEALSLLGTPLRFASVTLDVGPPSGVRVELFDRATREIKLEVLREDPRDVYLEIASQWSLLRPLGDAPVMIADAGSRTLVERNPSEFVDNALDYIRNRVLQLLSEHRS
jgi:hypothetical protein